ncbi:MAG: hypothetical protein KJ947_07465 [Alphaproteobacteria bacterium]|nr:hypothetical protein [Alphaproteobacteria bacterium]MBU1549400.1 hypothetical protein [Alphaproteobacteria bacterium]MBU2338165.1 hypothetical protein [Alphaproteobacteria bacterium]MBU2387552.1 hypothetical protein [Alphaproteobacteria bacterium]
MASPLKFLRRLVSRSGERKQDADKVDDAKLDALAVAGPTETVAEEGPEDAARPASLKPPHQDLSNAVSVETAPSDKAEAEIDDTAKDAGANSPTVGGSASPDATGTAVAASHDAKIPPAAVASVPRKQRDHSKNTEPLAVPADVSQGPRTPSDETMSLDKEIKALRVELASRLKNQNAQLKKMLERFER